MTAPTPISWEECNLLTSSPEVLSKSVTSEPSRWQHFIRSVANDASLYSQVLQEKAELQARVNALEGVDEQRVNALNQYHQSLGAQQVYQQQAQDHAEQLRQAQEQLRQAQFTESSLTPRTFRSPKHPDPEKFNGDKTKLEAFLTNLHLKLQRNEDHFTQEGQDTEYNKLIYAVARLEGDAFAQIEPFVVKGRITIKNIHHFVEILRVRFGEVDPVGTAKHEFYKLRQANKDLGTFLNTFLRLQNKAQIIDDQALDHLYEKLSDEVKAQLIPFPRKESLPALVKFLQDMDSNQKIFAKSSYRAKDTTSNVSVAKPPFKSSNSAPAKPSTSVGVTVTAPALSTATGTHPGPMDVSTAVRRGPISQQEKDRRNSLGLCRYCGEAGHIAIDHRNPALLASKRQAAGITNHSMALVPYNPLSVEEKESSLS